MIRINYSDIDQLISTVKEIFFKAPNRVLKFKELYRYLNLPLKSILTRWGTWLKATQNYCEHLKKLKM